MVKFSSVSALLTSDQVKFFSQLTDVNFWSESLKTKTSTFHFMLLKTDHYIGCTAEL